MSVLFRLCLVLTLIAIGGTAVSAAYPDRPIRLVVPFPAGGPSDVVARAVAPRLAARLGEKVKIGTRRGRQGAVIEFSGVAAEGSRA